MISHKGAKSQTFKGIGTCAKACQDAGIAIQEHSIGYPRFCYWQG